ncbi:MAG: hypothetical protein AABW89_03265 [Nanoarchaeota archaeon]
MKKNKLKGLLASVIPLAEALFYKNSAPHTPAERILGNAEPLINNDHITPYIGNFPESFVIPAVSGLVGDYLEFKGRETGSKLLEKVGKCLPQISTAIIGAYFTLGETLLPQILPGTADVRDVPAVIVSAFAGYTLAKLGKESGFNRRVYNSLNRANL